jgi:hypothetical protein
MPKKYHKPEEIVSKLRLVEVSTDRHRQMAKTRQRGQVTQPPRLPGFANGGGRLRKRLSIRLLRWA